MRENRMENFSINIDIALIKNFGTPLHSSVGNRRTFMIDNHLIRLEYLIERNFYIIDGRNTRGGIILKPSDAILLIKELNKETEIPQIQINTNFIGNNLQIFPGINYGLVFREYHDESSIEWIIEAVKEVINDLKIIESIIEKYKDREAGYSDMNKLWKELNETENINKKGALLEILITNLFQIDENFILCDHNIRTKSEEIDILVQPNINSPFWSKIFPPMILIECKNWKNKVGSDEIRDFAGKIQNRPKMLCRIGFIVAISGFTSAAEKELLGYRGRDFLIGTITGTQLEELINSKGKISDLLEKRLHDAGLR